MSRDNLAVKFGFARGFSVLLCCLTHGVSLPPRLGSWLSHALILDCRSQFARHTPTLTVQTRKPHTSGQELRSALLLAPPLRGLVIGIDANADFYGRDPEEALIGDLLAHGEAGRNDFQLLELCLQLNLTAPATSADLQVGPTWSWEHTSGRRKRLDHVLLQAGPWEPTRASQALDFDITNQAIDHVALRVTTTLHCPRAGATPKQPRRCDGDDVRTHGGALWQHIRGHPPDQGPAAAVASFATSYAQWVKTLPTRALCGPGNLTSRIAHSTCFPTCVTGGNSCVVRYVLMLSIASACPSKLGGVVVSAWSGALP